MLGAVRTANYDFLVRAQVSPEQLVGVLQEDEVIVERTFLPKGRHGHQGEK